MKEIPVFNAELMGKFDKKAEEKYGIPSRILMENAGGWVAKKAVEMEDVFTVTVISGPGNNGGDGIVAARHLYNQELTVNLIVLSSPEKIKGNAKLNLQAAEKTGINIFFVNGMKEWEELLPFVERSDLVVDAIFGTGLKREVKGIYRRAIDDINLLAKKILSVDLPSGVSSENGEVMGRAVEADFTVTFEALKFGHILPPGEEHCGDTDVVKIGIPPDAYEDENLPFRFTFPDGLFPRKLLRREQNSHKGNYGHVLVIAGSLGKTGAAAMTAIGALKSGAGLVTLATPSPVLPMVPIPPEIMSLPLKDKDGEISSEASTQLEEMLKGKTVVAVGPGLGTSGETGKFLKELIKKVNVPMVIDADGLNLLSSFPYFPEFKTFTVLTPHPGEFSRLTGKGKDELLKNRIEEARKFSLEKGVNLILKGYRTLICSPDGTVYINATGNPGMATGGAGDVLTGMIAGFLAQAEEDEMEESLVEAVGYHGLSGDLAATELTQPFLSAMDIIHHLPDAFKYEE